MGAFSSLSNTLQGLLSVGAINTKEGKSALRVALHGREYTLDHKFGVDMLHGCSLIFWVGYVWVTHPGHVPKIT
jgi:hypothetical protein